jgi:hypothetical protein
MNVTQVDFQRASAVRECAADIASRRHLTIPQARLVRLRATQALLAGDSAAGALSLASREARAFQAANQAPRGAA